MKSWFNRLLMVKEDEHRLFLYYLVLFFLLGVGLSLGRGSMTALFLKRYGVQYLPIMYAVLSVCMVAASLTYAAFVDRVASERLFVRMFAVLGVCLTFVWGAMTLTNAEWVYPAYYLLYEVASELLLLQAKLYAEQNFDGLQLQRLSSPMFASASIGKIVGGLLLGLLAFVINMQHALLIWAVLTAAPVVLILRRHRRAGISPYFRPGRKRLVGLRHSFEQVAQGVQFFRKTPLLRAASIAFFFMVTSTFILEYSVDRVLNETFPDERRLAAFIGWVSAGMGTIALLLQLFLVSRLLRRYGATRVGMALPVAMVASFSALLVSFSLAAAFVGIFTRDVIAQAVRKPARMALLHALPAYMMGRVNALSVGLVLPLALLCASGLLLLTQALPVTSYFIGAGLITSLCYIVFRFRANRVYAVTLLATLSQRLFLPHRHADRLLQTSSEELITELKRGVAGDDENMAYGYARMLVDTAPDEAVLAIAARIPGARYRTRDRLLRLLIAKGIPANDLLLTSLSDTDARLKATILEALFDAREPRAQAYVEPCLASDNVRLIALGVLGAQRYGVFELAAPAQAAWERLLAQDEEGANIAGLELLARVPSTRLLPQLATLLLHPSERVQRAALHALARYPAGAFPEFMGPVRLLLRAEDPDIRMLCVAALRVLDTEHCRQCCMAAMNDEHGVVRDAALSLLAEIEGTPVAVEAIARWVLENIGSPRSQHSAIEALSRYHPSNAVFERIARAKVAEASALFQGLHVLRSEYVRRPVSDIEALLLVILQERVNLALDLALLAMENIEDRAVIATIRAGLATGDRRHIAHACEALHTLREHHLSAPLIAIIDPAVGTKADHHAGQGITLGTVSEVIAWCLRHPDAWLRECATRAGSIPSPAGA